MAGEMEGAGKEHASNHQEAIRKEELETVDDFGKTDTMDTVHNDQGMKVLAEYQGDQHWDPAEEKKLRHKIDRKLISILCFTYGLQYYDKVKNKLAKLRIYFANVP